MSGERLAERAVLENKERDELRQIAKALEVPLTSRLRKAEIIDRIMSSADGHSGKVITGKEERIAMSSDSADTGGSGQPGRQSEAGILETEVGRSGAYRPGDDGVAGGSGGAGTNGRGGAGSAAVEEGVTAVTHDGAGAPGGGAAGQDGDVAGDGAAGQAGNTTGDGAAGRHGEAGERDGAGRQDGRTARGGGQADSAQARRSSRRRRGKGGSERVAGEAGGKETYEGELLDAGGLLDLKEEGYGFIRADGYLPSSKDVYVSISQVKKFALRRGDDIRGACRPAINNEKFPALLRIDSVNGAPADQARERPRFEDLTPLFPDEKLRLEIPAMSGNKAAETSVVTSRIIDLLSPIGKGQRGLIVSPPKAGKTTVMKQIAHSIETNNPEVHLIVLLVDERPEEVTDMRRSVNGEVISSTFDRPSDEHTAVAELVLQRAKRLVEMGRDVVIILDGITRLARAYNLAQPATGRIMSGGVDSGALYPPKRFFGAARNIEEGGSLTILATALVETGSKMDEVIFEEFKGTGNMELRLDRHLAERRLYPSIDVNASSTRHEELLFEGTQLQQVWKLRRVLNALAADGSAAAGLELLMDKIKSTKGNDEFLAEIAKGPAPPV